MRNSKKVAVILSYFSILANMMISILLTPLYLKYMGIEIYGTYQMIVAVASYILILDFGIGKVLIRFVTEYREKGDKVKEESIYAYSGLFTVIMIICVILAGQFLDARLIFIYASLTASEMALAHEVLRYMIVIIALTIAERYFEGIVMAHEQFSMAKLILILKMLIKTVFAILLILGNMGIYAILYADLASTVCSLIVLAASSLFKLRCRIKLHKPEKALLACVGLFIAAYGLQSVTAYVNNSLGKTLLGVLLGKTETAVYSLSMTFVTIFNMLPTAIVGVFLPEMMRKVVHQESSRSLTDMVVVTGRIQFAVCGAFIMAFGLFGQDFIRVWVGTYEIEIWLIALIVMLSNILSLVQGMCENIIDAMNTRLQTSLILLTATALNVGLSVWLIKAFGLWGAPIGMAISNLVGHGVLMNIYYRKKFRLEIGYMYRGIFLGVTKAIVLTTLLSLPLLAWECNSYIVFAVKAVLFLLIYILLLYVTGMNAKEKAMIRSLIPGYGRL